MKQPTAAQVKYWEAQLKRYKLTMSAGEDRCLVYGHDVLTLDYDGVDTYNGDSSITQNAITGESLELEEWPISLYWGAGIRD